MQASYPTHWEADVVLSDGGTVFIRPITPDDAEALKRFHSRLSPESIYFRFFAPYPKLSQRDVEHFTHVDYGRRVALIAILGGEMVGVARYDRVSDHEAEVAFVIEDAHQGRGLGSVLLEHIAAAAQERGIGRFVADVLPQNRRMIAVFRDAGYSARQTYEDGVAQMSLDLEPTDTSREVMQAREHRAEARSIQRLLFPRSVAVIGASRRPNSIGQTVLRHLLGGDFQGPVFPVHRTAGSVASVRAYPTVGEIPDEVDLAVVAVPAEAVPEAVEGCAGKGVHGLVVVSSGFGEAGPEGRERQLELVRLARLGGMRVVGPNCLGIANTDPRVRLNATLAPVLPGQGRVGFFSQSGALGITLLHRAAQRGLGLSTFVSAGNRADVSANDLMQYWEDDPATDAVLLYLESFGNPRKFTRLARRISRAKPLVVVKSGRSTQGVPPGHAAGAVSLPDPAVGSLFDQAGIIRVDDLGQLFDVAQVLAYQPLPEGTRVAIVGNSDALGLLAKDACVSTGLDPRDPVNLGPEAAADDYEAALSEALADPLVDSVVALFVPPTGGEGADVARVLVRLAEHSAKPIVSTFLAHYGMPEELRRIGPDGAVVRGSVPSYPAPENAVRAVAYATRYAMWRRRPAGKIPTFSDIDADRARQVATELLGDGGGPVEPSAEDTARLLACYGISVWPALPVRSGDEAVAAAERLGYPVALKTTAPRLRRRSSVGGVRLDLAGEENLRRVFDGMVDRLGDPETAQLVVQRMAPPGIATIVGAADDPSFGGIVWFGMSEEAAELLGDRAYRLAPLTGMDAAELVRAIRTAPLLFGYRGAEPVDVGSLEELLLRVSLLVDDLPEVVHLEIEPVLAGANGLSVLGAELRLGRPPPLRPDLGPRRLRLPT
ncbi:MAG: GNAT family N-acetyltransferase [Streptosporangiales bacterium]|nr:GNAT family N-acetyltransferase [Streptosporangiales bacterium]